MGNRFVETADGWWHDGVTGLQWSPTADMPLNHEDAESWCQQSGGRLPTLDELTTLVEYEKYDPCTEAPDTRSGYYWSASTYAPGPFGAWRVNFDDGYVNAFSKTGNFYVRAVRSGS